MGELTVWPSNRLNRPFTAHEEGLLRLLAGRIGACAQNATILAENRDLRRMHEAITSNVPAGVIYLRSDLGVAYSNHHVGGPFGATLERELLQSEPLRASCQAALARGEATLDARFTFAHEGGARVLRASIVPVRSGERASGLIVMMRDVTEEERLAELEHAEAARVLQIATLQDSNKRKASLLNTVAHEVYTPLTPMKIQLQILKTGRLGSLTPEQAKSLQILDRNVDRVKQLVADVLDMARLEADALLVRMHKTDLATCLDEALSAFAAQAQAKRVVLTLEAPPAMPVVADAARLVQVISNLVSNAIKYTPEGGWIRVSARPSAGGYEVSVADSGAGLTGEQISRLFGPFSLVQGERQKDGNGLGLFISRGIIEQHGGTLECESAGPDRGSAFTLTIPTRPRAPRAIGGNAPEAQAAEPQPRAESPSPSP
jgi:signal transduction histidine kinase